MKARAEDIALSNRDNVVTISALRGVSSQNLNRTTGRVGLVQYLVDYGRAYENGWEWGLLFYLFLYLRLLMSPTIQKGQVHIMHKALKLAAKMVTVNLDVQSSDEFLATPFCSAGLLA